MEMQRHPGRSADALWNNVLPRNIYEVHVHSIETRHVAPECVDPGSTEFLLSSNGFGQVSHRLGSSLFLPVSLDQPPSITQGLVRD